MLTLALLMALAPGDRLVTGTGLRIREAPDANAKIVEKVPLGSVLPCLEESKPVVVGGTSAPFCKTPRGWYFTPLTEPLTDRAEQIDALIARRAQELENVTEAQWPDVYAVNALMRTRIEESAGDMRLKARVAELAFVAAHANVFSKDPRVGKDDSQGPRVANAEFEKLVVAAKGTGAHEDAAWALYQHGMGGECEGYAPCIITRLHRTACTFLAAFPAGDHAKAAIDDVIRTLEQQADSERQFPLEDRDVKKEALVELAKVKACVEKAKAGDTPRALELVAATEKRWK